jgi:hypothetical protein
MDYTRRVAEHMAIPRDGTCVNVCMIDGTEQDFGFKWSDILRVCFCDGGVALHDILVVDIRGRTARIPLDAEGGAEFLDSLVERGLFPRELFDLAIRSTDGTIYCWPAAKPTLR